MTLSLQLGRSVGELVEALTPAEWALWCAYYSLHPFGPRQEEVRAGVVRAAVLGAFGGKVQPADLFPSLKPPPAPKDRDWRAVRMHMAAMCPAFPAWLEKADRAALRKPGPDGPGAG